MSNTKAGLKPYPAYKELEIPWLGKVPTHWTVAETKNFYEIQMGKMLQPQPAKTTDIEVPYLKAVNVQWYSVQTDNAQTMWASPEEIEPIEELARGISVPADALAQTVYAFNAAVQPGRFDPGGKDGKGTKGIEPPKSNWALPLDAPPYTAYPVTCGITFTFGGVQIDGQARVIDTRGNPIPGLYATGEITGGFFYHNYPGGTGLMRGAVFGRIAGASAAAERRD